MRRPGCFLKIILISQDLPIIYNKILVLTEEPVLNSFAESLAGRIGQECFEYLDAPVRVLGSANLPAVPLNKALEAQMLPNADKVAKEIDRLLKY